MKDYHVFISYSRKDDTNFLSDTGMPSPIDIIIKLFEKEGIIPWIDREGKYCGAPFVEEITKALSNSEMVLFISSKNSNDDGPDEFGNIKAKWVRREIIEADNNNMKIIPFRIDETPYNQKIKMIFNGIDAIEYFKDPKKGLDNLLGSIKKYLKEIKRREEAAAAAAAKAKADAEARAAAEAAAAAAAAAAKAKEEKIAALKKDIENKRRLITNYIKNQQAAMKTLLRKEDELMELEASVTIEKRCPICNVEADEIESDFCYNCGWHYATPNEFMTQEMHDLYEKRLQVSISLWDEKEQNRKEVETLKRQNIDITKERDNNQKEKDDFQKELDECRKKHKEELDASKNQLKAKQEELTKAKRELEDCKNKNIALQKNSEKQLKAKQDEILKTAKELQQTKTLLAEARRKADEAQQKVEEARRKADEAQRKADEAQQKKGEAAKEVKADAPLAFMLVTEGEDSNVYMLHKGTNVFGSMHAKFANMDGYQMIVACVPELRSKHFSLTSTGRGSFMLRTIDNAPVGKNSLSNLINEAEVFCGDILFIGGKYDKGEYTGLKISILDNFNK